MIFSVRRQERNRTAMPGAGHPTRRRIAVEVEKFSQAPPVIFAPFPLAPTKDAQSEPGAPVHSPPAGTSDVPAHASSFRMALETTANFFKVRWLRYRVV